MHDGSAMKIGLGSLAASILGGLVSLACTTDPPPSTSSDTDASASSDTTAPPDSNTSTSTGADPSTGASAESGTSTSSGPGVDSSTGMVDESSSSTGAEVCVSVRVTGGQLLTAPPDPSLILTTSTAATVEGWFYADAGAQGQIIGSRDASLPGWSVRYSGAVLALEYRGAGLDGVGIFSTPLPEDAWHHFAFVRSADFPSGWMLYVDGEDATSAVNGSMEALGQDIGCDYDFLLGAYPPFDNQQFSGRLGPMALSNTDRYTAPFAPSVDLTNDADTIALWPFDEGVDTTVQDVVGGNDLTMTDATWEQTGPGCP